jgi:hypothetical protein
MTYSLYTAETKEQALQKANQNLATLNANYQAISGESEGNFCNSPTELTASPLINNVTYYYGFEEPMQCIQQGYTCDLVAEFQQNWILPVEP